MRPGRSAPARVARCALPSKDRLPPNSDLCLVRSSSNYRCRLVSGLGDVRFAKINWFQRRSSGSVANLSANLRQDERGRIRNLRERKRWKGFSGENRTRRILQTPAEFFFAAKN